MGAEKVTQLGAGLVTVSFALMFLLPVLPPHGQLILIALSAVGFDLGLQSSPGCPPEPWFTVSSRKRVVG